MRAFTDAIQPSDLIEGRDSDWEPEAETTHYLPPFVPVFRGRAPRLQRAVCGALIEAKSHSAEPTCDECQAYVEADPYKGKTGDEVF